MKLDINIMIISSIVAVVGLATNSPATIVGSMLISPFNVFLIDFVKNKNYKYIGKYFLFSFISLFIGYISGIVIKTIQNKDKRSLSFQIPTQEMKERSKIENAYGFIMISFVCSFLFINPDYQIVSGIAIAVALLPPLINFGMYLGIYTIDESFTNKVIETGKTSAIVFFSNLIFLTTIPRYLIT